MYGNINPAGAQTFKERCKQASRAVAAGYDGGGESWLLAAYPEVSSNPFLEMLYSACIENGFGCVRMKKPGQAAKLPRKARALIHIHWINRVFGNSDDLASMTASEAKQKVDNFLDILGRGKDAGRPIVWTVHNILSHAAAFPEEELELRASLAGLVDHIHIMNPDTAALCAPYYALPAGKIFAVPHPSYQGIYADTISQSDARVALGLSPKDKVFLIFGRLGAYKGIRQFIGQLDRLQRRVGGTAKLVIAGSSAEPKAEQELRTIVGGRQDVVFDATYVDDQHVQRYFRAADVVVCGQRAALNSGVAHTAISFGCPVVLCKNLAPTAGGADAVVFPFEPGNSETMVDASVAALDAVNDADRQAVFGAWATAHAPEMMSNRFFTALRSRL